MNTDLCLGVTITWGAILKGYSITPCLIYAEEIGGIIMPLRKYYTFPSQKSYPGVQFLYIKHPWGSVGSTYTSES